MSQTQVMLDPLKLEVSICENGKLRTCSYQDAIGSARNANCLSREAITTICKTLLHKQIRSK